MSFKDVQASIAAREGIPKKNAGAILASSSRKASPAAKAKNPNLFKVKGAAKGSKSTKAKSKKKSTPKMPKAAARAGVRRVWPADSDENC